MSVSTSRKSCNALGSSLRMNGAPPPLTVLPSGSLPAGIASSSAAIGMNDEMPPYGQGSRVRAGARLAPSRVSSQVESRATGRTRPRVVCQETLLSRQPEHAEHFSVR